MINSIILKRDGFHTNNTVRDPEVDDDWKYEEHFFDTSGEHSLEFLATWNKYLTIDDDVLTGDLFRIMKQMDPALLTTIELITNSCWRESLDEAFLPIKDEDDKATDGELKFVEVYYIVGIDNHSDLDVFDLNENYATAHGVGKTWDGPEMNDMSEEERKNCNTWAIEFVPWNKLRNIPLRFRPMSHFSERVWKKGERRRLFEENIFKDEEWNWSDKDIDNELSKNIEIRHVYTVGDLFNGLASELCFFGSPDERDRQKDILNERIDEVEEMKEKNKN